MSDSLIRIFIPRASVLDTVNLGGERHISDAYRSRNYVGGHRQRNLCDPQIGPSVMARPSATVRAPTSGFKMRFLRKALLCLHNCITNARLPASINFNP